MKIYIHKNRKNHGPFTKEILLDLVENGNYSEEDLACYDGKNWVKVKDIAGFSIKSKTKPPQLDQTEVKSEKIPKEHDKNSVMNTKSGLSGFLEQSKEKLNHLTDNEKLHDLKERAENKLNEIKSGKLTDELKSKAEETVGKIKSKEFSENLKKVAIEKAEEIGKTPQDLNKGNTIELDKKMFINENDQSKLFSKGEFKVWKWISFMFLFFIFSYIYFGINPTAEKADVVGFTKRGSLRAAIDGKPQMELHWGMREFDKSLYYRLIQIPYFCFALFFFLKIFFLSKHNYISLFGFYLFKVDDEIRKFIKHKAVKQKEDGKEVLDKNSQNAIDLLDKVKKKISLRPQIFIPIVWGWFVLYANGIEPPELDISFLKGTFLLIINLSIIFALIYVFNKRIRTINDNSEETLKFAQDSYSKILVDLRKNWNEIVNYNKYVKEQKKKKK